MSAFLGESAFDSTNHLSVIVRLGCFLVWLLQIRVLIPALSKAISVAFHSFDSFIKVFFLGSLLLVTEPTVTGP